MLAERVRGVKIGCCFWRYTYFSCHGDSVWNMLKSSCRLPVTKNNMCWRILSSVPKMPLTKPAKRGKTSWASRLTPASTTSLRSKLRYNLRWTWVNLIINRITWLTTRSIQSSAAASWAVSWWTWCAQPLWRISSKRSPTWISCNGYLQQPSLLVSNCQGSTSVHVKALSDSNFVSAMASIRGCQSPFLNHFLHLGCLKLIWIKDRKGWKRAAHVGSLILAFPGRHGGRSG